MNDFEVMNKMSDKDMDIRMTPHVIGVNSTKKKSTISMEVDYATAQRIAKGLATNSLDCYLGLYICDKKQFDAIKNAKP